MVRTRFGLAIVLALLVISSRAAGEGFDLVWAIDVTGSMFDELAIFQVAHADLRTQLIDNTCVTPSGLKEALIGFTDTATVVSDLTSDASGFESAVQSLMLGSASTENAAAALSAAGSLNWTPGSVRHIVILTDDAGEWLPAEESAAIAALVGVGAKVSVVFSGDLTVLSFALAGYNPILVATGSTSDLGEPYFYFVSFSLPLITSGVLALAAAPVSCGQTFQRGDCNADGAFNVADAVYLLSDLFPAGGAPPLIACTDACDCNDDGMKDIADPISVLAVLFTSAPDLPDPYTFCGDDPTAGDPLDCGSYPPCP